MLCWEDCKQAMEERNGRETYTAKMAVNDLSAFYLALFLGPCPASHHSAKWGGPENIYHVSRTQQNGENTQNEKAISHVVQSTYYTLDTFCMRMTVTPASLVHVVGCLVQ